MAVTVYSAVILSLVIVSVVLKVDGAKEDCAETKEAGFRSRAFRHCRGRLGNHIAGYRYAIAMQKHFPEIEW